MFADEARWLRMVLADLPVGEGTRVLDVGSATLQFRTVEQPYIDREIFAPLRERGAHVTHLDAFAGPGVDLVDDITADGFDARRMVPFDVVVCANMLEHVSDRPRTIRRLDAVAGGHLLLTVPGHFPHHADPIDTMYRPTERELLAEVLGCAPTLEPVRTGTIQVRDPQWYVSRLSRCRLLVPPLRWRTTAAVFRRTAPAAA